MGTGLRFIAVLAISLGIAAIADQIIVAHFGLESSDAALLGLAIYGLIAIALFAVTYAVARKPWAFNWTAIILTVLLVLFALSPQLADAVQNGSITTAALLKDIDVTSAVVVPGLLLVLIQWSQLRRRWQEMRQGGSTICWPWITTVIGTVLIINPFGLDVLKAALNPSAGDSLRGLWLMIVGAGAAALLVGGVIEFLIRLRIQRARAIDAAKALAPDSEKWQQVFGDGPDRS